jgi:hypothetical protein
MIETMRGGARDMNEFKGHEQTKPCVGQEVHAAPSAPSAKTMQQGYDVVRTPICKRVVAPRAD